MRSLRSMIANQIFRATVLSLMVFAFSISALARPWSEHSARLAMLTKQIETKENDIRHLVLEKKEIHDEKKVASIMRQIGELQKALEKSSKEYEEEREHVRFEHPDKNDTLERVYVRHAMKSPDELEKGMGLDSRLDRAKARVLTMFPVPERKEASRKKFERRKPASVHEDEAEERVRLVK